MNARTLGFAALKDIKPDADTQPPTDVAAADRAAERAGFTSREPTRKLSKRPAVAEPTANLAIRPPVSTYNRFVAFSIAERLSYPEALKIIMDRAGIPNDG